MPERLRLMVTLASWCALRFGETVELRRGDVDLSDEVIRIRRAAVRTGGASSITTPKATLGFATSRSRRTSSRVERTWRNTLTRPRFAALPPRRRGTPAAVARCDIGTRRGAAGRADLRWHDLRHSGAVLAAATGAASPTDGAAWSFDTASRDALPARRPGTRPRDCGAAIQVGR